MSVIKLGVVGLSKSSGWASTALIPPLFTEPLSKQYRITALSTSSEASATANAEHFTAQAGSPVKAYSGDTSAIAADEDVDAVAVVIKAPAHKSAALPVIAAGKDIFVEWPAGKNIAETKEIAQAAKAKGIRSMVGLQSWQLPIVTKVREAISSGKIGKVTSVTWVAYKIPAVPYWTPFCENNSEYTLDPQNGASLLDIWIGHNLSAIVHALGPLSSLSAIATTATPEITLGPSFGATEGLRTAAATFPDQYAVSGAFSAHAGALFSGTWRALAAMPSGGPSLVWEVDGTQGRIRVESAHPVGGFPHVFAPDKIVINGEEIDVSAENAVPPTARAWTAFAENKKGTYPTLADALVLQQHVEAIKKSVELGKKVVVADM